MTNLIVCYVYMHKAFRS